MNATEIKKNWWGQSFIYLGSFGPLWHPTALSSVGLWLWMGMFQCLQHVKCIFNLEYTNRINVKVWYMIWTWRLSIWRHRLVQLIKCVQKKVLTLYKTIIVFQATSKFITYTWEKHLVWNLSAHVNSGQFEHLWPQWRL